MNYYLYSKSLNPNIKEIVAKKINPWRYPSITRIAKTERDGYIVLKFELFAEKYLPDIFPNWIELGTKKKKELFYDYMQNNQADEKAGNNFGIINKEGVMIEPLDFLIHVKAFNQALRKGIA